MCASGDGTVPYSSEHRVMLLVGAMYSYSSTSSSSTLQFSVKWTQ